MCQISGRKRFTVAARLPSAIWAWYTSYSMPRLGAPTSATMAAAWSVRVRKKPGKSCGLSGSITTFTPTLAASSHTWATFST